MSETQKPSVGRIVHVCLNDGTTYNGAKTFPAIVTAVHTDTLINARVFVDGPEVLWLTSIPHVDTVPESYTSPTWGWPPRD